MNSSGYGLIASLDCSTSFGESCDLLQLLCDWLAYDNENTSARDQKKNQPNASATTIASADDPISVRRLQPDR